LAVIEKSLVGPVVNTAVWTVSGTGDRDPFVMSTQVVVPETLLDEQPVWNPKAVPEEEPVTL
jgi:hypothetical protein